MPRYLVTWTIDIFDVDSHEEAARKAFEYMQRPGTTTNVFEVIEHDSGGESVTIDLQEIDEATAECVAAVEAGLLRPADHGNNGDDQ